MGITIYYRGRINSLDLIGPLSYEMEDIARSLGWGAHLWNEDLSKPNTARIQRRKDNIRIIGHVPLNGITLFPHRDCEQLSLTFDRVGNLTDHFGMTLIAAGEKKSGESWLSTKTQFSPLETHMTIVKIMQYLKKHYVGNLEVHDDGGYWETGDVQELRRRTDLISHSMDILGRALSAQHLKSPATRTPEEIATIIERIFRDKFGGQDG